MSDSERMPEPGTEIGRFTIERVLGEGGMGVVFAAWDRELRRNVALKILHLAGGASAADVQRRMLREAQAMALVSHPNLVTIYDVGVYVDHVFLAMEYVEGAPLAQWLKDEPRTLEEVMEAFEQAGRALQALHEAGLVHRDFKPDNVLVDEDGNAKLLDLGIVHRVELPDVLKSSAVELIEARRSGDEFRAIALEDSVSEEGALVGTPAYMSPEQLLGTRVSPATDQFAFAIALYEAICGTRPFQGKTELERISRTIAGEVGPWPEGVDCPDELRAAIERMLSGEPKGRFPSMDEALTACRLALGIRGQIRVLTARWLRHHRDADLLLPDGELLAEGHELLDADPHAFEPDRVAFLEASSKAHRKGRMLRRTLIAGVGVLALGLVPTGLLLRRRTRQLEDATRTRVASTIAGIRAAIQELFHRAEDELLLMADQHRTWMPRIDELRVDHAVGDPDRTARLATTIAELNGFFRPVVEHSQTISSLMVSTETMELLFFDDPEARRLELPYEFYNRLVRTDDFGDAALELFWKGTDEPTTHWLRNGQRDRRGRRWSGYDPAARAFFQRAVTRDPGEVAWTKPYLFFVSKDAGITGSTSFDWEGRRYVLAVDLTLIDISRITRSIESPGVLAVVLTRGEEVVGLPRDDRFRSDDDVRGFFARYDAQRLGDEGAVLPEVSDLGLEALSGAMRAGATTDADVYSFELGSKTYWVGRGPVGNPDQDLSVIVIAEPR